MAYSGGSQGLTQVVVPEKKISVTIFQFQSCLPNEIFGHNSLIVSIHYPFITNMKVQGDWWRMKLYWLYRAIVMWDLMFSQANIIFWDVTLHSLVAVYWHFIQIYCLHQQQLRREQAYCYQTTRYHTTANHHLPYN